MAVALVTGAAQGIGLAITNAFLKNSYKVYMLDILKDRGIQVSANLAKRYGEANVLFHNCDVTDKSELKVAYEKVIKQFGHLDIVCNNAGIGDELDWERTIDVNLGAVIRSTKLAYEYMSTRLGNRGGVIINIASAAGLFPMSQAPVYTATKHAVIGFSRALKSWHQSDGIRVNCICPGFVDTELFRNTLGLTGEGEEDISDIGVISPQVVGQVVQKIVADSSINGAVVLVREVDGTNWMNIRVVQKCKL